MITPGTLHHNSCFPVKGHKVTGEIVKILGIMKDIKWPMKDNTAWLQDSDCASAL